MVGDSEDLELQSELTELEIIVQTMIETLHHQSKLLDRLAVRLASESGMPDLARQLSVTTSTLSELHYRVRKLTDRSPVEKPA
jgi:hypothetical protein